MNKKEEVQFSNDFNEYLAKEKERYFKEVPESERIDWDKVWDGKKGEENKEVDWNRVDPVGSSKLKVKFGEFFKGLWFFYLFLCLVYFGGIIADIVDNTNFYTGHLGFFIPFLIPSVIYIIYKAIKKIF